MLLKNAGSDNNTVKASADKDVNIVIETIDASYMPLLKFPIATSRNFSADYPSDSIHSVLGKLNVRTESQLETGCRSTANQL